MDLLAFPRRSQGRTHGRAGGEEEGEGVGVGVGVWGWLHPSGVSEERLVWGGAEREGTDDMVACGSGGAVDVLESLVGMVEVSRGDEKE